MANQQYRRREKQKSNSNTYEKYGTWSERVATIVGIVVGFFTLLLFWQTRISTQAAVDGAKAAQQAVVMQRQNDSAAAINDSIKEVYSKTHDSLSLIEQRRYVDAQIRLLKEQQRQFEISNQPYLQCINFDTGLLINSENPDFTLEISNLGNYPAQISESGYGIYIIKKDSPYSVKSIDSLVKTIVMKKDGQYIIKGTNITMNNHFGNSINSGYGQVIVAGLLDVYVCGKIYYYNLISKKRRMYKFCAKISFAKKLQYTMLYNYNVDL